MEAQILTPDGVVFNDEVIGFQVPGEEGNFEIKKNHASLISNLEIGRIRAKLSEIEIQNFAVSGGFIEVVNNKIYLLAEAAERVDDIDQERAENAKERAEKRLKDRQTDTDHERARKAWVRAENRLKIAASG